MTASPGLLRSRLAPLLAVRLLPPILILLGLAPVNGCDDAQDQPPRGAERGGEGEPGGTHATTSPGPPAATEDQLRAMIQAAENIARLNVGFMLSRQVSAAEATVRRWAAEHFATDEGAIAVQVIGTRSGYPELAVAAPGNPTRLPVIVTDDDEVLVGTSGFRRFVMEHEPEPDAVRWATAWLLLHEGIAREPLGHWSLPVNDSPRFVDDVLRLAWTDENGQVVEAEVAIDARGAATTRSRRLRRHR